MNVLVTGGAGYIGSHTVKELLARGHAAITVDNLSEGHRGAVPAGTFYEADLRDTTRLREIVREHSVEAVLHFAAFCSVGESVTDPAKYYRNNLQSSLELLETVREEGIGKFIFSSTCATYGDPIEIPMTEAHPQNPVNPYGETKLAFEKALRDYGSAYGIGSVSLRYFNAAGADPDGELGEDHRPETHLIPIILAVAAGERDRLEVYGNDYPTADGSCVRDYIHVVDLAQAHILALERLEGKESFTAYNLGTGKGYSVLEVIQAAERVTGRTVPYRIAARRAGDPAVLVAGSDKVREELGWDPELSELDSILETAWAWHRSHPQGYDEAAR